MLETARLILRPWQITDAGDLYKYASDPAVGPIAGWPAHESIEESRRVIREVFSAPEIYAVVLKETGRPAGCAGFVPGSSLDGSAADIGREGEIGYWLGVPFWGQGIIPEAVRELIRHGFADLNMDKIWCGYFDGNLKSKRVMEKCGFRYHHTRADVPCAIASELRTEHVGCITREEWEAALHKGQTGSYEDSAEQ